MLPTHQEALPWCTTSGGSADVRKLQGMIYERSAIVYWGNTKGRILFLIVWTNELCGRQGNHLVLPDPSCFRTLYRVGEDGQPFMRCSGYTHGRDMDPSMHKHDALHVHHAQDVADNTQRPCIAAGATPSYRYTMSHIAKDSGQSRSSTGCLGSPSNADGPETSDTTAWLCRTNMANVRLNHLPTGTLTWLLAGAFTAAPARC